MPDKNIVYLCKNMAIEIFRAFLVGICAAVPAGPVLILVLQKTLRRGRLAGVLTGAGSAFADTVFAAIGLFTLSLVQDFIARHEATIMSVGGAVICIIGLAIFLGARKVRADKPDEQSGLSMFGCTVQAAGTALSNPAALAYMLGLLSVMRLTAGSVEAPVWSVLVAVAAGELFWWTLIAMLIARFLKVNGKTLVTIGKAAGAGIACFGIILIVKGLLF